MLQQSFVAGLSLGRISRHGSMTILALHRAGQMAPEYLTLDEAIATGRFRIEEVSEAGTVPELRAVSELDVPVLLLDGEELIGAKQNRVLNLSVLVPEHSSLTIPVSCVESGRWRHQGLHFGSSDRAQYARGRARKLVQVSAALEDGGPAVADQADVWDGIALKSARIGVRSPTGAMAAMFEHANERVNTFVEKLGFEKDQVGMVCFIGGELAGLEAFDTPQTYAKLASKLVRSYALDALDASDQASQPGDEVIQAGALGFLSEIGAAEAQRKPSIGLGEDIRFSAPGSAGAALSMAGRIVHLAAYPMHMYADVLDGAMPG